MMELAMAAETGLSDSAGCFVWVIAHFILAVLIYFIAAKLECSAPWWAFIPIFNLLLLLEMANRPWWWIFLFLIPIANVIVSVVLWMEISQARGKPAWMGLLMIVPGVNVGYLVYLAFSE